MGPPQGMDESSSVSVPQFGRRSQFDRELQDEFQFHIESRASELQADGLTPRKPTRRPGASWAPSRW